MAATSITRDVVFAQTDHDLHCDIYSPSGEARGVVILLHGGGWRVGSRQAVGDLADLVAERGWHAVAAQYRLLPEAPWPAPIQDVKQVVRWVRGSTDRFGPAANTVALAGFSAGGHLALLAAGTGDSELYPAPGVHMDQSELPDAVVSFFPPIRVDGLDAERLGTDAEGTRQASPIEHVSETFPPTMLLHGTGDTMIPYSASVEFFEALRERGVPADLRLYARGQHEFQRLPELTALVFDDIVNFLDRHLVGREQFEAGLAEMDVRWRERSREREREAASGTAGGS